MKLSFLCCVFIFCSIFSTGFASREVVTEHVMVVYSHDDHLEYAKRVAYEAEQALDKLIPLFRWEPRLITLIIDSDSGLLSGRATPFPHPTANISGIDDYDYFDYRTTNLIYALVVHELFHVVQGTYSSNSTSADTIIQSPNATAIDLQIAPVVPTWFVEGIATWSQVYDSDQYRISGVSSARVTGIVETLALEDKIPEFKKAGSNHGDYNIDQWPGRLFPYDIGGAFSYYLVETYGFEAILETLTEYNALGFWGGFLTDFSTAWHTTQGSHLEDIWIEWQDVLKARAQARANTATQGKRLTYSGYQTQNPVVSPDGSKLAWSSYETLWVAQLRADGSFSHPRDLGAVSGKFDWLDDHHVVYIQDTKLVKRNIHHVNPTYNELDTLSLMPYLVNSVDRQNESIRRFGLLRFADTLSQDCVLLIQNGVYGQSDELWRWCNGKVDSWTLPEQVDLIDASASHAGQIVVNVWQSGFTDFAIFDLESGSLNYLTQDVGQDLDPVWLGEDSIVFRSDRHRDIARDIDLNETDSVFDLYRLDISSKNITRLTRTIGGAFRPSVHADQIWYNTLSAKGYDVSTIAIAETLNEVEPPAEATNFPSSTIDIPDYDVRGYQAGSSLLPDALVPEFFIPNPDLTGFNFDSIDERAGLALIGQDRARKHTYYIGAGYQFNPDYDNGWSNSYYDEETGEVVEVENTFEPYWYGYADYEHRDWFSTASNLEYYNTANFNLDIGPELMLNADSRFEKTIAVTENFKVTPSFESRLGATSSKYFDVRQNGQNTSQQNTSQQDIYVDRYSIGIQPALNLNYKLYFSDIILYLNSRSELSSNISSSHSTPVANSSPDNSISDTASTFTDHNVWLDQSIGIGLGKSFIDESSVWNTNLNASTNLNYSSNSSTGFSGYVAINRSNTDNWYLNLNTNIDNSSSESYNNQSYNLNQDFAYKLDMGNIGLNLDTRTNYSSYEQFRTDIDDQTIESSNSSFTFDINLDSFYAFSDLLKARAFLGSQANYSVRPTYNPNTDEEIQRSYESITSLARVTIESFDFEGLRLGLRYQHPITWHSASTNDGSIEDNAYTQDDWSYQHALTENVRLSFQVESQYNPSYESTPLYSSLAIGIENLYDAPFLYSDAYLGYRFNNYNLKDSLNLNIYLSGGELYQPNVDLSYGASLPPLVTWDGKYGFQSIDLQTGISYDIATNQFGGYTNIYLDTIFSYQWNLGFRLGIEYSNDEWRFSLF